MKRSSYQGHGMHAVLHTAAVWSETNTAVVCSPQTPLLGIFYITIQTRY